MGCGLLQDRSHITGDVYKLGEGSQETVAKGMGGRVGTEKKEEV